eukprot:TRINITY_DN14352_c0_g3_i1.p1 TRINITY_DN14352_c0_g3~~TRINITY_DN14352_c0_g3_i1.p1  ORF type:complete len:374 (-),score=35.07 TRINITY_DN14352_c0_g3_i1:33-1118(-)
MPARARAVAMCVAIVAVFVFVAGEEVVDAASFPRGATKLRRRMVRRATRKERSGVIRPSFRDGVMSLAVDASVDATGDVKLAKVIMSGHSESSDAATVAAGTPSRSKRDAFRVGRFADIAADILDGSSLPSRSHSGNGTWLNLTGKKTFQSFTHDGGGVSTRVVDGSPDNKFTRNSCITAKPNSQEFAFWQIDLEKNYSISRISIVREDRRVHHISPFSVTVDGRKCIDSGTFPQGLYEKEFECDAVGRHVRVSRRQRSALLVICEVKLRVRDIYKWKTISGTRICEDYFHRGRAELLIKTKLDMPDCSLESCQDVCQRETGCRSIDWFAGTCICQPYRAVCPANQTNLGHNEGSSHELES